MRLGLYILISILNFLLLVESVYLLICVSVHDAERLGMSFSVNYLKLLYAIKDSCTIVHNYTILECLLLINNFPYIISFIHHRNVERLQAN